MPTMGGTIAEQVARPGGKTYTARRPPRVEVIETPDDEGGVIVSRTHDVDLATALAQAEWEHWTDAPLPPPQQCWLRLVPWDHNLLGVDSTYIPAEPGERGAFPAIEFTCRPEMRRH